MNKKFLLSALVAISTSFFSPAFAGGCEVEQIVTENSHSEKLLISCSYKQRVVMLGSAGAQLHYSNGMLLWGKTLHSRSMGISNAPHYYLQKSNGEVEAECEKIGSEVSVKPTPVKLFCELVSDKKVSGGGIVYSEPVETGDKWLSEAFTSDYPEQVETGDKWLSETFTGDYPEQDDGCCGQDSDWTGTCGCAPMPDAW